jgi:hypothetical protein
VVNATPWPFYARERGWVVLRAGVDGCGKCPPRGFEPRTIQKVARKYPHYSIPSFIAKVKVKVTPEQATKAQRGVEV